MKLLLATHNRDKIREMKSKLSHLPHQILSLDEIADLPDVLEDRDTLEGNSHKKAFELYEATGITTIADDTGLMVDALNGAPGVYSARFAGEGCSYDDNCNKLLDEMKDKENRDASFITIITIYNGEIDHQVKGELKGKISREKSGSDGFGYDPIFIPEGDSRSLAEYTLEEKNEISHRGRALGELIKYLEQL